MSLRSGFISRGFLFLGPDVASFGYMDGTDVPYHFGEGGVIEARTTAPGPAARAKQTTGPTILAGQRKTRKR